MERDAGGERRGEKEIWGGRRGWRDELQPVNNECIFCLTTSFFHCGSIHLLCHHHLSAIIPLYHPFSPPYSLLFFPLFFVGFLTSMCSLSFSRHGWQRSMSTPSRMWSSCCWATRWDLVANTGRWMDRWTHRGRDHGGRYGGSVRIGFMNVSGSRERDFPSYLLFILVDFQMSQNVLGGFTSPIHRLTIVLIRENNLVLKIN